MTSRLRFGEYYGNVLRSEGLDGLSLTELRHACARTLPEHSHAASFFCLLLEGTYRERVEGRMFDYQPLAVGFHPRGIPHRDTVGPSGGLFLSIEVSPAWLRAAGAGLEDQLPDHVELYGGRMSALAAALHLSWSAGARDAMSIEEAVLALVAGAAGVEPHRERGRPRWLAGCFEILHAEHAMPLTIAGVAARSGVHPVHLSREFRRRFGQTMGEYVNLLRVRSACERLRRGDTPLAEVALDCGFADQSHLCRVFKKLVGCSPGRFRGRHGPAARARGPLASVG